jgi:16S rRNA (adenine1518-N6/adenine1519-N6)-dimethyltransferase
MLTQAGTRPQHRHGQHFLIDRNLMQKLVDSAEIGSDDVILEVGPGTGSLTSMLAERAAHVVSVEIDARIAEVARRQLAAHDNITLLVTDALKGKNRLNPEVIEVFLDRHRQTVGRALLVANLPYNAASPIVADLLLQVPAVRTLCFTVQKEVADRMTAPSQTSDYGPLTIIIQALAQARRVAKVPQQAFWPAPDVESAIVKIEVDPARKAAAGDPQHLAGVVHQLFLHRRKTLWQNLKLGYGEQADVLKDRTEIDWRRRPEELSVEEWVDLARSLAVQSSNRQ